MEVILVDDDKLIRDDIKTYFQWEQEGFHIANEFSNGIDAWNWLRCNPVDIVLTDISMPRGDGIELIHQLKTNGFEGEIIVMSNYDDFDYVKDAMKLGAFDYCLKYKMAPDSLLALLQSAKSAILGRREHEILPNRMQRQATILDYARQGMLSPQKQAMYLSEGVLQPNYVLLYIRGRDSMDMVTKLSELEIFMDTIMIQIPENEILIAFPAGNGSQNEYFFTLNSMARSALEVFPEAICVFVPEVTDPIRFQSRFEQIIFTARTYFYEERQIIQNNPTVTWEKHIPNEVRQRLETAMLTYAAELNDVACRNAQEEAITYFRSNRICPKTVRAFFENVFYKIGQVFENEDTELPFSIDAINTVTDLRHLLTAWNENFFMIPTVSQKEEIISAIHYIHANYKREINLEEVSQHVFMSRNHFCTVFRKEMGEGFVMYIQRLRIEKAKILLKDHRYRIQEVAEQVGIDNYRYFSTLFHKYTGMSPTQYRENLQ